MYETGNASVRAKTNPKTKSEAIPASELPRPDTTAAGTLASGAMSSAFHGNGLGFMPHNL
jgi:hypothetical protein